MSAGDKPFRLSADIERYVAILSKLYAKSGRRDMQEILVNAKIRVEEERSYDDFNGAWGHALWFAIPELLFANALRQKEEIEEMIKRDINGIHHMSREFIEVVFLEMDIPSGEDWRQQSGLLVGKKDVLSDVAKRIWGSGYKVFLSHRTSAKKQTAELKDCLQLFGISAFVAHEDIHPTKEWQGEIENALASAEGFVVIMTDDFHESEWTDQEVGYALARGIPVVAVRLGRDPYGFIAKFQAISGDWTEAPGQIARAFVKHENAFKAYMEALGSCPNWTVANLLAQALPGLEMLSDARADQLVSVYNSNQEVSGGFGFNGQKPKEHGLGLVHFLNLYGKRRFRYRDDPYRIEAEV